VELKLAVSEPDVKEPRLIMEADRLCVGESLIYHVARDRMQVSPAEDRFTSDDSNRQRGFRATREEERPVSFELLDGLLLNSCTEVPLLDQRWDEHDR
jgi:hypothetical protein